LPRGRCATFACAGRLRKRASPTGPRLLELGDQDKPEYRALQPFGQVPIFEEDGRVLFESGAIVLQSGSAAKRSCLRT
jgi:glutathione S-transferase